MATQSNRVKRLILDLDDTICKTVDGQYKDAVPDLEIVAQICAYKAEGFDIVIHTSRNVRTFDGNVGKITAHTLPVIIDWLKAHSIPYDEIFVGKPWCGHDGFYVDDKAIRPSEFRSLSYQEIVELLSRERK